MTQTVSPREFDEHLASLYDQADKAERQVASSWDLIHRLAGDRKEYVGRRHVWRRTAAEVDETVRCQITVHGDERNLSAGCKPSEALARRDKAVTDLAELMISIHSLEQVYRHNPWTRYFPCRNADGHIHSTLRACSTVRWDTDMAWYPQLSGKTVEEAVAELGPTLCSVCFPLAPVEWRQKKSDIERAGRESEKAARADARSLKNLDPDSEQFRDTWGWVTTVAGAKKVLRDEVEYRDYYGNGRHPSHAATAEAAEKAKAVLLAREAARPGSGATQGEIDTIIANAVKRNRKDGARI